MAAALAPLGGRVNAMPLPLARVLALIDQARASIGKRGARKEEEMRLGLTLTGDQLAMADIVRFAGRAEEAGFDSIWVTEAWREAFVSLTAIAMQTNRVRIGTAIALTMARSPVLMELAATAVDEIAQGRLILGIGPGPKAWNENWHAVRFHPPAAYVREYAEVLRLMWTAHSGKRVDYQGKYLQIREYQRFSRPYRERIPIYFGAVMPKFLRATGAVADGLCVPAYHTPRYIADVARRYIAEGMQESQRAAGTMGCMSLVICSVDEDREKARARAKQQIALYTTFPYDIVLAQHDLAEEKTRIRAAWAREDTPGMVAGVSEQMVDLFSIAGTPQDCRQALARYEGLVDEVSFYSPTFGLSREEVLTNHAAILDAFGR